MSNLALANEVLKTGYTEAMRNSINTETSYVTTKILQNNKGYDGSEYIESTIPIGLSGGAGFGDLTGLSIPSAANVNHKKYKETPKEFFVSINLLDRLIRSTKNEGAIIDYLDTEIKGAVDAAKWSLGRSIWGNGKGVLAKVTSAVADAATISVDSAINLTEGLLVDIYPSGAGVGSVPTYKNVRITGITGKRTGTPSVMLDKAVSVAANAFITLQKSYGNEITGIGTLFDSTVTEIGGISKSSNPWIVPQTYDAKHDLSMEIIRTALRGSDDRNGKVDVLAMGSAAYDAMAAYFEANNTRLIEKDEGIGGFKTLKFLHGNRVIAVSEEKFVAPNEIIGICTDDVEPHLTELDYTTEAPDAPAFMLIPGTSIYQALMVRYGNIIYKNAGGFFKITNANNV